MVEVPKKFEKVFPLMKKRFKGLNRFTQEVIRHLLEMTSTTSILNIKLIKQLYGKLSCFKFIKMGAYTQFENEKKLFLKFIYDYFKSTDKFQNDDIFCSSINSTEQKIIGNSRELVINNSKCLIKLNARNKEIKSKKNKNSFKCKYYTSIEKKRVCNKLKNLNVNSKYVEHWHWLNSMYGSSHLKTVSFENLLFSAFSK